MKKITVKILLAILAAAMITLCFTNTLWAKSTSDAKEYIDTEKKCALKVKFYVGEEKIQGAKIEIYRAAVISEDFKLSIDETLGEYHINISEIIKTQSEWDEFRDTAGAYITAYAIEPDAEQMTDENGEASFYDLPVGIYYVRMNEAESRERGTTFLPFVVSLPDLGEDGKWVYDAEALPKPGVTPETDEMTVTKLWRDGGNDGKRTEYVEINIYRSGELYEEVRLGAENNWTYTWKTEGNYSWTAIEKNVPDEYTVIVRSKDASVQITNVLKEDPNPPVTGDTFNVWFWVIIMAAIGSALILISLRKKKVV